MKLLILTSHRHVSLLKVTSVDSIIHSISYYTCENVNTFRMVQGQHLFQSLKIHVVSTVDGMGNSIYLMSNLKTKQIYKAMYQVICSCAKLIYFVPSHSSGNLTLLVCRNCLLFEKTNMAVGHVRENATLLKAFG